MMCAGHIGSLLVVYVRQSIPQIIIYDEQSRPLFTTNVLQKKILRIVPR